MEEIISNKYGISRFHHYTSPLKKLSGYIVKGYGSNNIIARLVNICDTTHCLKINMNMCGCFVAHINAMDHLKYVASNYCF